MAWLTMDFLALEPGGGLPALKQALQYWLYAFVNEQRFDEPDPQTLIFRMVDCRVQASRRRKKWTISPVNRSARQSTAVLPG